MTKTRVFGLRCMPKIARTAALAALAGCCAAPAAADGFCAGLREAIAHAAEDFQGLLLDGEAAIAGAAPARNLLPDGSRCEVRASEPIVEYRCRMTAADATSTAVRAAYRRELERTRRCFVGLVPRGDGDFTGSFEWTGAVIWALGHGIRAAVVFVTADDIAQVAGSESGPPEDANAVWVVVDRRR